MSLRVDVWGDVETELLCSFMNSLLAVAYCSSEVVGDF
jgi:hypothetical protein